MGFHGAAISDDEPSDDEDDFKAAKPSARPAAKKPVKRAGPRMRVKVSLHISCAAFSSVRCMKPVTQLEGAAAGLAGHSDICST